MIRVLKIDELAQLLDCTVETLRERAANGDLPAIKMGRSWIFPAAALEARLNELAVDECRRRRSPSAIRRVSTVSEGQGKPARKPPALPTLP